MLCPFLCRLDHDFKFVSKVDTRAAPKSVVLGLRLRRGGFDHAISGSKLSSCDELRSEMGVDSTSMVDRVQRRPNRKSPVTAIIYLRVGAFPADPGQKMVTAQGLYGNGAIDRSADIFCVCGRARGRNIRIEMQLRPLSEYDLIG